MAATIKWINGDAHIERRIEDRDVTRGVTKCQLWCLETHNVVA